MSSKNKDTDNTNNNSIDLNQDLDEVPDLETVADQKNRTKFQLLFLELNKIRKDIIELQKKEKLFIKKLEGVHNNEIKKLTNKKRRTNTKATGFAVPKKVGGKLADWLKVPRDSEMSGPQISKTFWKRINEDGLQYEEDKRIFRTNKEVTDIFGVLSDVNKSTDPEDEKGFNMRTYQTHIKYALVNNNS